ncbi:MAG: hypothetical protein EOM24_00920 [Chloroflexia bacterium]|nr:hypothetical protein [Chloroflexia bacterium]
MVKGDGRGGKRRNAGRKRKRFIVELDDQMIALLKEQHQAYCLSQYKNLELEPTGFDYEEPTLKQFFHETVLHFIMQGKFKP